MNRTPHPIDVPLWDFARSMKSPEADLGQPVACELSDVQQFGERFEVEVRLWRPKLEGDNWVCPFEASPFTDGVRLATGSSALEALERVDIVLAALQTDSGWLNTVVREGSTVRAVRLPPGITDLGALIGEPELLVDLGGFVLLVPRPHAGCDLWTVELDHGLDRFLRNATSSGAVSALLEAVRWAARVLPRTPRHELLAQLYAAWTVSPTASPLWTDGDISVWAALPDGRVPVLAHHYWEQPLAIPASSEVESMIWGMRLASRFDHPNRSPTDGERHGFVAFSGMLPVGGVGREVRIGAPMAVREQVRCDWQVGDLEGQHLGVSPLDVLRVLARDLDICQRTGTVDSLRPPVLPATNRRVSDTTPSVMELLEQVRSRVREREQVEGECDRRLTEHYADRLLRLAAQHVDLESPEVVSLPEGATGDPVHVALATWFDQREAEVTSGTQPGWLPIAGLEGFDLYKADRIRQRLVLLEPVEPLSPLVGFHQPTPSLTALARSPTAESIRSCVDALCAGENQHPAAVPLLLQLVETLDSSEQAMKVFRRLLPHTKEVVGLALEVAVQLGIDEQEVLGLHAVPLQDRERVVRVLVTRGDRALAEEICEQEVAMKAPLLTRESELALARLALGRPLEPLLVERCIEAIPPGPGVARSYMRRLCSLAARGHPRPLAALDLLSQKLIPIGDPMGSHTHASAEVLGRLDAVLSALVEVVTGERMDSPQRQL